MTVIMNQGLWAGATIVTMPRFDLDQFLELIERHGVTRTYVVPPIALALAKHPALEGRDLSTVRTVMSGAAPLGGDIAQQVSERIGCKVIQGYGLTETSPVTHTIRPSGENKPGSIGLPLPSTECRVVDPETGEDLEAGERGELWMRGPQIMRGYLDNPDATAETIDADGWLHTGDVAVVDEEGFFEIVDVPDDEAGELPKAFVVPAGEGLDPDELIEWVAQRVSPQKRIRLVELTDEIPKSPSGKILRRVLRDRARSVDAV